MALLEQEAATLAQMKEEVKKLIVANDEREQHVKMGVDQCLAAAAEWTSIEQAAKAKVEEVQKGVEHLQGQLDQGSVFPAFGILSLRRNLFHSVL